MSRPFDTNQRRIILEIPLSLMRLWLRLGKKYLGLTHPLGILLEREHAEDVAFADEERGPLDAVMSTACTELLLEYIMISFIKHIMFNLPYY